ETRIIPIDAFTASIADSAIAKKPTQSTANNNQTNATSPTASTSVSSNNTPAPVTEQDSLAANLADNWWT
ncbi:hypothetical protein CGI28_26510, partial [Vibrio parahaemolyticus]